MKQLGSMLLATALVFSLAACGTTTNQTTGTTTDTTTTTDTNSGASMGTSYTGTVSAIDASSITIMMQDNKEMSFTLSSSTVFMKDRGGMGGGDGTPPSGDGTPPTDGKSMPPSEGNADGESSATKKNMTDGSSADTQKDAMSDGSGTDTQKDAMSDGSSGATTKPENMPTMTYADIIEGDTVTVMADDAGAASSVRIDVEADVLP